MRDQAEAELCGCPQSIFQRQTQQKDLYPTTARARAAGEGNVGAGAKAQCSVRQVVAEEELPVEGWDREGPGRTARVETPIADSVPS